MSGLKYDSGKPRMELLDPQALEGLAKVLTFGASKYSKYGECNCIVSIATKIASIGPKDFASPAIIQQVYEQILNGLPSTSESIELPTKKDLLKTSVSTWLAILNIESVGSELIFKENTESPLKELILFLHNRHVQYVEELTSSVSTMTMQQELLDRDFVRDAILVLDSLKKEIGQTKHSATCDSTRKICDGADNWRGGINNSRLWGALLRHGFAILRGEDVDPESGLPHIDHLGCCWMFLSWNYKSRPKLDDRKKYEDQ